MRLIRVPVLVVVLLSFSNDCYCWGFFGHKKINACAVFLLPPPMILFYKQHAGFLTEHAVDPDKRRYLVAAEGPRHYIDLDHYGSFPYKKLPHKWDSAVARFSSDSLEKHGIVPWWIQRMHRRLTNAFKEKNAALILKLSAEIGHYIGDAHVPLHTSSNHNGQLTDQVGIHGFWESRIPELFAEKQYDFIIGKADYLRRPDQFIWERVLESAAAADTVLMQEKLLNNRFSVFRKYAYENRNGLLVRQYSEEYTTAYQQILNGMVERRMRQSVYAVACFWFTAWVDAGQPDLNGLSGQIFSAEDLREWEELNRLWNNDPRGDRTCAN